MNTTECKSLLAPSPDWRKEGAVPRSLDPLDTSAFSKREHGRTTDYEVVQYLGVDRG